MFINSVYVCTYVCTYVRTHVHVHTSIGMGENIWASDDLRLGDVGKGQRAKKKVRGTGLKSAL